MQYDLTNNKISFTYGRVVQVVSGSYYDGFGNPLNLPGYQSISSITANTSSYNVTFDDYTILCDATSGSMDIILPAPTVSTSGKLFNIKKIDSTGNLVNVYVSGSSYIDYSVTQSLTSRGTNLAVQSSTTQYWIL